ncbi:hypothetical protein Tco_1122248 [Tanacetum coccineum]|uniref:Uncharacterized protein n=1 Tax=Tanacetum coccineum TaxID=301880 RepID=A0ABQ5J2N0_9ASTR
MEPNEQGKSTVNERTNEKYYMILPPVSVEEHIAVQRSRDKTSNIFTAFLILRIYMADFSPSRRCKGYLDGCQSQYFEALNRFEKKPGIKDEEGMSGKQLDSESKLHHEGEEVEKGAMLQVYGMNSEHKD